MKVVTVIGARPQFVKAAVLSRLIAGRNDVTEVLVHTGQHYDFNMSDRVFADLELPVPDHSLGIGSGRHGQMTGRMLEGVEKVLLAERPDWVLVYGDTNSTLAGALAAAKLNIPVAHVEAGLRSFNRRMPEELNRVATDHLSTLLFAPTKAAMANLSREGLGGARSRNVGDVMYDAALHYAAKAERTSTIIAELGLRPRGFVLVTIHRAENTDDPVRLAAIADALRVIAQKMPVVWPVHPRTRNALRAAGIEATGGGIHLLDPVGYLDMIQLERAAERIATDSGGVQKEAYFFNTPCVTLRQETEWVELVECGANRLVSPADREAIVEAVLSGPPFPPGDGVLYGNGHAGDEILSQLLAYPQE